MKILSNIKMRIFILAFALVALGGATTGMFFAASQNASVLASETDGELIAGNTWCGSTQKWDNDRQRCVPICKSDEVLNAAGTKCIKISTEVPVESVILEPDHASETIKKETLGSFKINTPSIIINPDNATDKGIEWKSKNTDIVTVNTDGTNMTAVGFGTAVLTACSTKYPSVCAEYTVVISEDKNCPNNQKWVEGTGCQPKDNCELNDPNWEYVNGTCVTKCSNDQERVNGACVPKCSDNQIRGENGVCVCKEGYEPNGNGGCKEVVQPISCGTNAHLDDSERKCVCDDGFIPNGDDCIKQVVKVNSVAIEPDSVSSVFDSGEELSEEDFLDRIKADVIFTPADADDIDTFYWTSSNPAVIEVIYPEATEDNKYAGTPSFKITGYGTTVLTLTNGSDISDQIEVTITKEEIDLEEIKLEEKDITKKVDESDLGMINIYGGDLGLPEPELIPNDATNVELSWESDNTDILISTTYCSTDGTYDNLSRESVGQLYGAYLSQSDVTCDDGIKLPVFIPVSYGTTTIYVTDGRIESNKINLTIEKGISTDTDGDGLTDDVDPDIDGDGYLNDDDSDPYHYAVDDRDLLMFATLAYDPVDSLIDRIDGNTKTQNGKTVRENYYEDNGENASVEMGENGYARYFSYICADRISNKQAEKNECMYDEDRLTGMQAQDYSGLDGLIKAWQTVGKDYYFGGSDSVSVSEVNQWVITDHVSQRVTLSKKEGYMEATTYRLNNNIVIAYRGTDFTDLMEWFKDATFILGGISGYEDAAKNYAKNIFSLYANEYYANPDEYIEKYGGAPNFYITGHSLGGYLAQIGALGMIDSEATGLEFLRDVIYFNGMGMGFFGGQREIDYNKLFDWATQTNDAGSLLHRVICYHINGDPVSALGRHINKVGYYASEGAINRHATQNVSKLQTATRNRLADGIVDAFTHVAGKTGELGLLNTSQLDDVKDYLDYYSNIYGDNFKGIFNDGGTISILDLMWFCHEPSASLFHNIKKGINGHTEVAENETKLVSRDYLITDYPSGNEDPEAQFVDWYGEMVNVTSYKEDGKIILTAQVTGDAKDYTWYNGDQEVGTGKTLRIDENNSGSYYVKTTVNSRRSNITTRVNDDEKSKKEITLSTEDAPIKIDDMSAPTVSITAIDDIWRAKTDSNITLKITAKSASGFSKSTIDTKADIVVSSLESRHLVIGTAERVDAECNDQTEVWILKISANSAATFTMNVKEGTFISKNNVSSKATRSKVATFTAFTKEEDITGPKISITPLDGVETEKGGELRFEITATDEGGIKDDNLAKNITIEPVLPKIDYEIVGEPTMSNDGKKVTYVVSVSYDDDSRININGQILVWYGAFVDNNGNKSKAESSSTFKFLAPPDKTAPTIKIEAVDGNKTEYGGTITYNVVVSDDSGLDPEKILTTENIVVTAPIPLMDITEVKGPIYNDNQTVASYKVSLKSNSNCSAITGCFGTFRVKPHSVADIYDNENVFDHFSESVVFASEIDRIAPFVNITPVAGRTTEKGESIEFKVVASDNSGIDENVVLTKEDFEVGGIRNKGDVEIESLTGPKMSDNGRKATYYVKVRGNEVVTGAYIRLPSGKIKDNNGNSNIFADSELMIFTKPLDLISPKIRFEPADSWSTTVGYTMAIKMIVTDNDELKKNQRLDSDDFDFLFDTKNDMSVVSVGEPVYSNENAAVSYDITLSAKKSGSAYLYLKLSSPIKDVANNSTILTYSPKITFRNPDAKDTEKPRVVIEPYNSSSWKTKAGKELRFRVIATDNVELATVDLSGLIKVKNSDIKISDVKQESVSKKKITWIITVTCDKNTFSTWTDFWGNKHPNLWDISKLGFLYVPDGVIKDTAGNGNPFFGDDRGTLVEFTYD